MDGRKKIGATTLPERMIWLCLFYIFFLVVYGLTGVYTSERLMVGSVVFDFEHRIPFLPWMVLPYMSSGLFFVYVFYLTSQKADLYLLVKRLLFVTTVAGIVYWHYPLRYSFFRPETSGVWGFFFDFLSQWDTPFNQAPSLHITYAFIFWSVIRRKTSGEWKTFLALWLVLMGVSTLTVYQHHLVDIVAAFLLVTVTFLLFPHTTGDAIKRNDTIAYLYFLSATVFLILALWLYDQVSAYGLFLLWPAVSLLIVGIGYLHGDSFFLKKEGGEIKRGKQILCYPYQLAYLLFRSCCRRGKPVTEILPGLFIGARLSMLQVKKWGLHEDTVVFDLAAELEEHRTLMKGMAYYSCPVLDMAIAPRERLYAIADRICEHYHRLQPGEKIYIHCTMGYTRSMVMGVLVLMRLQQIESGKAITLVRGKCTQAVLPDYIYEMI